jgi:hypothetical protein
MIRFDNPYKLKVYLYGGKKKVLEWWEESDYLKKL